jgi:hypothetical protein
LQGTDIKIVKAEDKIIDIEIPMTMTLEVTQTDPGEKGNTAQGASKPATLETGATINVPLFIKVSLKTKHLSSTCHLSLPCPSMTGTCLFHWLKGKETGDQDTNPHIYLGLSMRWNWR